MSTLEFHAPGFRQRSKMLILLGSGLLLGTVGALLAVPPSDGFEQSIYAPYPLSFWMLFVSTFLVGLLLVVREAFAGSPNSQYWKSGFVLSLATVALLTLLPDIRGYVVYGRADLLTHIGYVNTIVETGGGPFQNVYQSLHQLVLALSYATGLEPLSLVNAVAAVITVFSILASYALLAAIFERRRLLMTLPFVTMFVAGSTHVNPSPYAQSAVLLPFVLYLYARTQQTDAFEFRAALAVTVISAVLYHPLTGLFLFVALSLHYLVAARSGWQERLDVGAPISRVSAASIAQLAAVTFLAWYYNFAGMFIRFDRVYERLVNPGEGESELDTYGETILEFSPAVADLARVGWLQYGQRFMLLALGSTFVLVAAWRYLRGERFQTPYLPAFTLGFVTFSALGVVFLVVDLIGGFGRPLVFAQYFAAFLAGSVVLELYDRLDRKTVLFLVTLVVVALLASTAVASLYASSAAGQSTSQATTQDFAGAEWYLENELYASPLEQYGTTMHRFEHALNNSEASHVQRADTMPPDRFNYTRHDTLGASYDFDQYLVITERGQQFYPNAYPDYREDWRFQPADFEALENDPTLTRVYDNGYFEIYRIDAEGG